MENETLTFTTTWQRWTLTQQVNFKTDGGKKYVAIITAETDFFKKKTFWHVEIHKDSFETYKKIWKWQQTTETVKPTEWDFNLIFQSAVEQWHDDQFIL